MGQDSLAIISSKFKIEPGTLLSLLLNFNIFLLSGHFDTVWMKTLVVYSRKKITKTVRVAGWGGIDRPVVPVNREMSYGYYADEFQLHTQLFTCNTSIRLCEAAEHMDGL